MGTENAVIANVAVLLKRRASEDNEERLEDVLTKIGTQRV
jgi:hypothetical protein